MFTVLQLITTIICLIFGIYKGVIKEEHSKGTFWICLAISDQLLFIIDKLIFFK